MQMTTTKITAEKSMSFIWINCVGASARLSLTLSVLDPLAGPFCGAEEYLQLLCGKAVRGGGQREAERRETIFFSLFHALFHSFCFNTDKEVRVWTWRKMNWEGS